MSMIYASAFFEMDKAEKIAFKAKAFEEAQRFQKNEYAEYVSLFFGSVCSEMWGHTFILHCQKTNDFLMNRLTYLHKRVSAATTFKESPEKVYELLVSLLLSEEVRELVSTWLFVYPEEETFMVQLPVGRIIGRGYTRNREIQPDWRSGPIPCSEVCLVFTRDFKVGGFRILSAYPAFDGMGECE